ncbi:MAG: hypothetical protein WB771_04795 [Solirubrobacterales bacterium]
MLIDELMPRFDRSKVETVIVEAEPARVYSAVLEADLMQAYKGSPAMRVLFAARDAPSAIARRMRKEPAPPEPDALRLDALEDEGEWVKLGEDFGQELVFGAIGRFWGRDISWETIGAEDFKDFRQPGFGKVAANFSVRSYGIGRTLLTYEARTAGTHPPASRAIKRYWVVVGPGIGIVLRGTVRYIKSLAERP